MHVAFVCCSYVACVCWSGLLIMCSFISDVCDCVRPLRTQALEDRSGDTQPNYGGHLTMVDQFSDLQISQLGIQTVHFNPSFTSSAYCGCDPVNTSIRVRMNKLLLRSSSILF